MPYSRSGILLRRSRLWLAESVVWFAVRTPLLMPLGVLPQSVVVAVNVCSRGLPFTWWGCCGLCFWHKPTELAHIFLFCSCVCFCLEGPFNFTSLLKFSGQIFPFSLCSSGPISALLVFSTMCLFMKVSFSPDTYLCGWLGLRHQVIVSQCLVSWSIRDVCGLYL